MNQKEQKSDNQCKRCLLYEMADKAQYESLMAYVESIPVAERADDEIYKERLRVCKECEFFLAAMCRKCGCYVELRAAGKSSRCPNLPAKW